MQCLNTEGPRLQGTTGGGKATKGAEIKKVGNLPSELCGLTVMHGTRGVRHRTVTRRTVDWRRSPE